MQKQQVVVVTGATGGLGSALVRLHLERGDTVIAAARSESRLEALAQSMGNPAHLFCFALEVTDAAKCKQLAEWVQEHFGQCSLLYNNAGTASFEPFAEMNLTDIKQTIDTNVNGLLYITHAFLPMMLATKTGHIVNIASLAGQVATAKAAVYAGSKAAVIRFSEGLRHELAKTGIQVTCVMPGPIDTPFLDHADRTGAYRGKVQRYLLTPEKTARRILHAVEKKQDELALPRRLHLLSLFYLLLPAGLKRLLAPLLNRK
ncbi:SDR family NAD(P)-dependent oxidoreductase [Brevibacillus ruminantium]|uniref:SDR family NAD(P)-dependent oxidoreductase n=1 Tax=Brevibacillus ruminantium TaxID=2950604 RepID=A0ABY4WJE6_9BACL|nr:SDR family NAD(P)-dependent oxidoreductase [Brevibacillus ruminantium]USG67227.1 SDR family NAD(P)-dependent oxidoreductase [Brevibacillus ruminantium]